MKTKCMILFLISILIFSSICLANIEQAHEKSLNYFKKGKINQAIEVLEKNDVLKIIKEKPDDLTVNSYVSILNDYAFYLSEINKYNKALPILEKVLNLKIDRTVTYLNIGDIYYQRSKEKNRKENLSKAKFYYEIYIAYLEKGANLPDRVKELSYNEDISYKVYELANKFTGTLKRYYSNGILKEVSHYKDGLREGKTIGYYDNVYSGDCLYINGDESNLHMRVSYIYNYRSGRKNGEETKYYKNYDDKEFYIAHYKNGKLEGNYKEYYKYLEYQGIFDIEKNRLRYQLNYKNGYDQYGFDARCIHKETGTELSPSGEYAINRVIDVPYALRVVIEDKLRDKIYIPVQMSNIIVKEANMIEELWIEEKYEFEYDVEYKMDEFDYSALKYFTNLKDLRIYRDDFSNNDVVYINYLKKLEKLYIRSKDLTDISDLKGLNNLKWLSLKGCNLVKINFLQGFRKLNWINLKNNKLQVINGIKLKNLKEIILSNNDLTSIKNINCPKLERLEISQNRNIIQVIKHWEVPKLSYRRFVIDSKVKEKFKKEIWGEE